MNKICLNGKIIAGNKPVLLATNRGFRYGDAIFETMKVIKGKIILSQYHFERLFNGLRLLRFKGLNRISRKNISKLIFNLCKKNKCEEIARTRLTVFRGNGGLYEKDEPLQYLIECWPLNKSVNKLNKNGFEVDVFHDAQKNCDKFSNLKTANYLPYVMGVLHAKKNKLDDCLILNSYNRICDATIANIFWIKGKRVYTTLLNEGCIAGVMRRHILDKLPAIKETKCTVTILENADEIFLTNSINGIRWVKRFKRKIYSNIQSKKIYSDLIQSMYQKLME